MLTPWSGAAGASCEQDMVRWRRALEPDRRELSVWLLDACQEGDERVARAAG